MMYHEYVIDYEVDYEVWNDGRAIKWGTYACSYDGELAPNASVFTKGVLKSITEYHKCEPESVRVRGVFKL